MTDIRDIRRGILAWALVNGIMADNIVADTDGDARLAPFEPETIDYFRTRKIVRVTVDDESSTLTIYSRLKIAVTKAATLQKHFVERYPDSGYRLVIDFTKPFRIDQSLDTYGPHEPLRWRNQRLACGSSVGLGNQRNAGTLAALLRRKGEPDQLFGLTCNHVTGGCGTTRPGTPVVMPGIQDIDEDFNTVYTVGDHETVSEMRQGLPSVYDTTRNSDLAFFRIRDASALSSFQGRGGDGYDTPHLFEKKPRKGLAVKKWGRSTGFTTGEVELINDGDEPIPYNVQSFFGPANSQTFRGIVYFHQLIEVRSTGVKPFSLGGDSGALVVTNRKNAANRVIGIVIAGNKDRSLVLPIHDVLDAYRFQLVHSPLC